MRMLCGLQCFISLNLGGKRAQRVMHNIIIKHLERKVKPKPPGKLITGLVTLEDMKIATFLKMKKLMEELFCHTKQLKSYLLKWDIPSFAIYSYLF